MKKSICILLIMALFLSVSVHAETMYTVEDKPITVTYNGELLAFTDAVPQIINGRTLVPVRVIMERAGMSVAFEESTGTILAQGKDVQIEMRLDETVAKVTQGQTVASVALEEPARLIDGRTFVPVRFVAESLQTKVNWNPAAREVVIIDTAEWKRELTENSDFLKIMLARPLPGKEARTGSFGAEYAYYSKGEKGALEEVSLSVAGTSVFDGTNAGVALSLEVDRSFYKPFLQDCLTEAQLQKLFGPSLLNLEIIADKDWNVYIRSSEFLSLLTHCGRGDLAEKIGENYICVLPEKALADRFDLKLIKQSAQTAETYWDFVEKYIAHDDVLYSHSVTLLDNVVSLLSGAYNDNEFRVRREIGGKRWENNLLLEECISDLQTASATGSLVDLFNKMESFNVKTDVMMQGEQPSKMELTLILSLTETVAQKPVKKAYGLSFGTSGRAFEKTQDNNILIPTGAVSWADLIAAPQS
ncbi:MAG: copper amine oxidase N-terminal domain-containing protein [Ruminococcaceae bacterium]|nr:copper amine oxidase N-terminal domain-containing protein [Oscillospiraceae bacterium]